MSPTINATLVAREDLTEHLGRFRLRHDDGPIRPFAPGQFVQVGLPGPSRPDDRPGRVRWTRRSYSIASSARDLETVELYLARVARGELTSQMWGFEVGARLWLDPEPKGHFTLERVPAGRELVLVATGTGVAPYVSMLRTHDDGGAWSRWVLVHGVRQEADLGYRAELEARAARDPRLAYIPVISREPASTWTGLRGRVQAALDPATYARCAGADLDPARCHVFLCGHPAMIDDVRALLEPRGFRLDTAREPGNLHLERYW